MIYFFRFIKHLSRGYNSCSRCDLQFQPLPGSTLLKKREERSRRSSLPPSQIKEERRDSHRHEDDKRVHIKFNSFHEKKNAW